MAKCQEILHHRSIRHLIRILSMHILNFPFCLTDVSCIINNVVISHVLVAQQDRATAS